MKTVSITIEENLYHSLKKQVPPGKLSKFVSEAIKSKISSKNESLAMAYKDALNDNARNEVIKDWKYIDGESL